MKERYLVWIRLGPGVKQLWDFFPPGQRLAAEREARKVGGWVEDLDAEARPVESGLREGDARPA